MIEVRYKARLGNNLFQYCLGRIIAEELGFKLCAEPIPGFPNTALSVVGEEREDYEQILTGQQIDLPAILADRRPRKIILDGWFQRYEYYRPYRNKIREWLALDPEIPILTRQPELVVHVRRTDYVSLGWALPFSYYDSAIERALPSNGEVWLVSDDRSDPFLKRFKKWNAKFFAGSALQQFGLMRSAVSLVLSQSTFSWWPAFLGDASKVIA